MIKHNTKSGVMENLTYNRKRIMESYVVYPRTTLFSRNIFEADLSILARKPCYEARPAIAHSCAFRHILFMLAAGASVSGKDEKCLKKVLPKLADVFR